MSKSSNSNLETNQEIQKQQTNQNEIQIEDLLRQLHSQIRSGDWLTQNTANKLENENPELIKAWKEAVNNSNEQNNS